MECFNSVLSFNLNESVVLYICVFASDLSTPASIFLRQKWIRKRDPAINPQPSTSWSSIAIICPTSTTWPTWASSNFSRIHFRCQLRICLTPMTGRITRAATNRWERNCLFIHLDIHQCRRSVTSTTTRLKKRKNWLFQILKLRQTINNFLKKQHNFSNI